MTFDWATATADEILARLEDLDAAAFEQAVANDQFTEEHVRLRLNDPGLSSAFVERISREPRFFQKNSVRVALALHPKLPRVRGLELLRYLYWRDLLRVASRPGVHPQVRVIADQLLSDRIPDLTLGEKMTLARQASRAVVRALRTDPDPRVIEALLRNVRCTEEDAVRIATSADTPGPVLSVLARAHKWRSRPEVRSQLVRNRRLPMPIALGLLTELSRGELAAVVRQAELPKLVRESARRLLTDTANPRAGRHP